MHGNTNVKKKSIFNLLMERDFLLTVDFAMPIVGIISLVHLASCFVNVTQIFEISQIFSSF